MKPINAEETVRVFNGWLEEADSLAEREAIERCIDHIQDAPAVSQQELRSYMLPWFSPFAAPWCGKIQRAFPKAYVTMNFELILVPRTNTYTNLGNGINHELCMKFVKSGYDLKVIEESV